LGGSKNSKKYLIFQNLLLLKKFVLFRYISLLEGSFMKKKNTPGLFDEEIRLIKLTEQGDPLIKLNSMVPWEIFRKDIEKVFDKETKGQGGRPRDTG